MERHGANRPLKALIITLWSLVAFGTLALVVIDFVQGTTSLVTMAEEGYIIGLAFFLIATVGALAAMGQPRNGVGWILLFAALATTLAGVSEPIANFWLNTQSNPQRALFAAWSGGLGWYSGLLLLLMVFPYLFPDGLLPGTIWRPIFAGALLYAVLFLSAYILSPLLFSWSFDPALFEERIAPLLIPAPFFILMGDISLIYRYRRADTGMRQQMKWLALALGLPLGVFALIGIFEQVAGVSISNMIWGILYAFFPVGLGIALLRYRMFDVDTIIRKTAVYSALTILLALVYFGIVIVLQRFLTPVTGETTGAIVLSTLLIAALFLPLRRRVQAAIDRRFYRRKYDAEKVLEQFAATVRDETDLDALTAELLRVIQETMQPEFVSLWLANPDAKTQTPELNTQMASYENTKGD